MNNALPLSFISILLTLVMYFVLLNLQQDETGLNIGKSATCEAICCLNRCETHKVEVVDAQHLRYAGGLVSPDDFANHLRNAHQECEIWFVHIQAAPDLSHETVLNITSRVLEVAPNTEILWGKTK